MKKKICSIGVDIDTFADYITRYGGEDRNIPYDNHMYTKALPRILDLFDAFNINATFFVVGRDIKNPRNLPILKDIIKRGHEIGNHTMNHIYPFSRLPYGKKKEEIVLMHRVAEGSLGYKVKGFRAPSYGIDGETLQILEEQGYVYDSSVHPTCLLPLINSVIFVSSYNKKLPEFKSCLHCFAPSKPYIPKRDLFFKKGHEMKIIEIPITVTPFFRMPFYGTFHLLFGKKVFDFGYYFLQKFQGYINYEMHAIEMLDSAESNLHEWFNRQPGINIPISQKMQKYYYILNSFRQNYEFKSIVEFINGHIV